MKRTIMIALALAVGTLVGLGLLAVTGRTAPEPRPYGSPVGPRMPKDTGAGEMLVVVLGGVHPTRAEAAEVDQHMAFGDLQGYYVVPVAQFQGFREQVGVPGDYALVSVFRTDQGAQEFAALARSFGYPATILPNRVRSLGGIYAGLGQEANPDGSGPLLSPIPESLP
ncbi:MAG: hypothetical protein HYU54_04180 [Actinobacteria bacterium]|nr:hypothetical protein [Actinomycetota bacterium]